MKELNVNFRSIVNKIDVFQTLIDTEKPDILTGTETWLSSDINSSEFNSCLMGIPYLDRIA